MASKEQDTTIDSLRPKFYETSEQNQTQGTQENSILASSQENQQEPIIVHEQSQPMTASGTRYKNSSDNWSRI